VEAIRSALTGRQAAEVTSEHYPLISSSSVKVRFQMEKGCVEVTHRILAAGISITDDIGSAQDVQMAIKGLRGMDVRRGPMHNDRGLHGLAVTRS
jgi:hypothetical protein